MSHSERRFRNQANEIHLGFLEKFAAPTTLASASLLALPPNTPPRGGSEDRVLDGPASGGKGSKGRNPQRMGGEGLRRWREGVKDSRGEETEFR